MNICGKFPKMHRIALYIRVSKEDNSSVENQEKLLREFVLSKKEFENCEIIVKIDNGFSGTNFNRPAAKDLLKMAKNEEVDIIIVKDFSRFARNSLEVINYLEKIFPFLGVRFISINDNYDSDKKNQGVDVAFKNLIYSLYSQDLSGKITSGQIAKAKKGEFINAKAPFGYKKEEGSKNKLVKEPTLSKVVERIFKMCLLGLTTTEIAKILNDEETKKALWRASDIAKILEDERYLGKTIFGKKKVRKIGDKKLVMREKEDWIVFENTHEAIIKEKDFEKVRLKRMKITKGKKGENKENLFSKKIFCRECGYALGVSKNSQNKIKYKCLTYQLYSKCDCNKEYVFEEEIAKIILILLNENLNKTFSEEDIKKFSHTEREFEIFQNEIKNVERQIKRCEVKKSEAYEMFLDLKISKEGFLEKKNLLNEEAEKLSSLQNEILIKIKKAEKIKNETTFNAFKKINRQIIIHFVDKIYINKDKSITIKWNFCKIQDG